MSPTTADRFWAKVEKHPDGCWLWTAGLSASGYAQFYAGGFNWRGHRWAYSHFIGVIPRGKELHHACGIKHCVNPEHLKPLTSKDHHQIDQMMPACGVCGSEKTQGSRQLVCAHCAAGASARYDERNREMRRDKARERRAKVAR